MNILRFITILTIAIAITSCEKVSLDEISDKGGTTQPTQGNASLIVHIGQIENLHYANENTTAESRATEEISNVCSKLTLALFQDGTRVFYKNQDSKDGSFGNIETKVPEGKYTLMVIAHSNEKHATTTKLNELTFDGKVSDTFHYAKEIELKAGNNSFDIVLQRATAMFRLEITDQIPDNAKQLKFYYTGGSSTLDGTTGYGNKNSRQTEYREIKNDVSTYDVYTFPHQEKKNLKITVTALDASGSAICEKVFENVDIEKNVITHYKGSLFGNVVKPSEPDNFAFRFTAETNWAKENTTTF